jgi:hypothetical protein
MFDNWFGFAVVCISDKNSRYGYGVTSFFQLPEIVVNEIKNGKELGEVMDELTKRENTKQKEGAIGILTKGAIDRKSLYVPAIVCALIPFLNKGLFERLLNLSCYCYKASMHYSFCFWSKCFFKLPLSNNILNYFHICKIKLFHLFASFHQMIYSW